MRRLLIVLFCVFGFAAQAAEQSRPPNFVVILTDDQGYGDLGCFGGMHVNTPQIDRMAMEGARLTSFYVAAPVCTPSRAALMTGCYPKRIDMAMGSNFGVLLAEDSKGLNPDEITIAEVLKGVGYKTGIFGKWHLGDQPEFLPTRQGFGDFFGLPYSHDIHPFHPRQEHFQFPPLPLLDGETVIETDPDADNLTRRITERAIDFIDRHKEEPFFLYVPHPIPHRPIHMSQPFMEDIPKEVKLSLENETGVDYLTRDKIYSQSIREIDWSVGEILDALKRNGIDENTLVIFTSDNGASIGKVTPLSGGKGSSYEGGMRVPTVIRWPGNIPAGVPNDELMTAMDLLPTFAELAGAAVPDDRVIDGKNITSVLMEGKETPHEAFFFFRSDRLEAVRSGPWKLHFGVESGQSSSSEKRGKGSRSPIPALYNVESDLGERENLIEEYPEIVDTLRSYAKSFLEEMKRNSRPAGLVADAKPLTRRED